MATIHPSLPSSRIDFGYKKEIQVLEDLTECLPEGYEIFHEVDWYTTSQSGDKYGEVDLVVLGPTGNVLLIEIKSGSVDFVDDQIFKRYSVGGDKNVTSQIARQRSAIHRSLSDAGLETNLTNCLVLPDFKVLDQQTVSLPRERVIDSEDYNELGSRIKAIMTPGERVYNRDALRKFFLNRFDISFDLQAHSNKSRLYTVKLAEGLATWVPRMKSDANTYLINATAGSGKTQLALKLLNDSRYQKALYCCYNRPLAEHMRSLAPTNSDVTTFHELCVDYYERKFDIPNFQQPDVYQKIEISYLNDSDNFVKKYGLIIIDESQDFRPEWVESLIGQLNESGSLYIFSDQDQNIYERDEFDISGAVTIACNDNYRSPSSICDLVNLWRLTANPIQSKNPYKGRFPEVKTYTTEQSLINATGTAIKEMLEMGIAMSDVTVLTWHGQNTSVIGQQNEICGYSIQRNTGAFDRNRNPIWTTGDILVETVNRYKGKGSAGIILTEIDFSVLSTKERQRLFVGLTRSHMMVTLIMKPETEAELIRMTE